LQSDGRERYH